MGDRVNREGWIAGRIQAACLILFVVAAWKPAATRIRSFGAGLAATPDCIFVRRGAETRAQHPRGSRTTNGFFKGLRRSSRSVVQA